MGIQTPSRPPFHPIAPIGQGGYGAVWRVARQLPSGQTTTAAAKLLLEADPDVHARFLSEVRAVAAMQHPNIVRVLDYGMLEAPLQADGVHLAAGRAYLLMPLASGSLHGRQLGGESLRSLLLDVLAALAHAHARGIVHRDLKPANVLAGSPLGPPWLLADFGISHAFRAAEAQETSWRSAGTLRFMAPEQIRGALPAQGPWTDLYALGCLARDVGSADGMLRGRPTDWVRNAHLLGALPPVPGASPQYAAWLDRIGAVRPEDRFQSAAEAAWALRQVDALPEVEATAAPNAESLTFSATGTATGTATGADEPALAPTLARAPAQPAAVPIPERWSPSAPWTAPPGTGASVVRLRDVGVYGRDAEQAALWSLLRESAAAGAPRVVVLRGPAGVGKSHLARWLVRQAYEQLGAVMLFAAAEPGRRLIPQLVEQHLRSGDHAAASIAAHLQRHRLDAPGEHAALLAMLAPAPDATPLTAAHQRALLERLLARETRSRPAVVVLDDAHHSVDAIQLAHSLARPKGPAAVVVAVVQDEALLGSPAAQAVQALCALPEVTTVSLGPLSVHAQQALLRELLGLDEIFALQLAERTAGNPQYATQLVDAWLDTGHLTVHAEGLRLSGGSTLLSGPLPDAARTWEARLAAALGDLPDDARHRLEQGAVLGMAPDPSEWTAACAPAPLPHAAIARLAAQQMLRPEGSGWAFTHPRLREALLAQAQQAGRAAEHHRRAADAIAAEAPQRAFRRARHLLEAGAVEDASADLQRAFRQADHDHLREALGDSFEAAFSAAGLPPDHLARGTLLLEQGRLALTRHNHDRAEALLDDALGWPALRGEAGYLRARLAQDSGQSQEGLDRFRSLRDAALQRGDIAQTVTCEVHLSMLLADTGQPDAGRRVLLEAAQRAMPESRASHHARNMLLSALFFHHIERGELDAAEVVLTERNALVTQLRLPRAMGMGQSMLSRLRGLQGQKDEAIALLEDAEAQLVRCGAHDFALDCRLNRAMWMVELSRFAESSTLLTETLGSLRAHASPDMRGKIHLSRLICDGALGDAVRWTADLAATRALLLGRPMGRSRQVASILERAGDRAASGGMPGAAREAWAIAARIWAPHNSEAATARLAQKMAEGS